jgi:c-di-GMP-binding flagellar brake protein YcgR
MEKKIGERRKYRRVKGHFNIKIDTDVMEMGSSLSRVGKSIDISGSGILFRDDKLVDLGTILKLTFLIPNSFDFFQGKAKVVRTEINPDNKTYDIGIVFIGLDKDDEETLNYYVTKEESF